MRFSLLSLFGLMAACAVAVAALVNSSYLAASLFFTGTVCALLGATAASILARGRTRAIWLTFALFGWTHFALALGPWFDDHTGEFMASRHLIDLLGRAMGKDVADHVSMPGIWHNLPYATGSSGYRYLNFVVIGQCLFTVVIGSAAACGARYFYERSQRSPR